MIGCEVSTSVVDRNEALSNRLSAIIRIYIYIFFFSSSGTELPLMVESYGLLNDIFPSHSILDAGYTIFNLHLANVLFDVILPSVLGSTL